MNTLINKTNTGFRHKTLLFVVILGALVFAMGIVRGRCISKGYELSQMATDIEKRRIQMERVESARSAMFSRDHLFPLATEKGFILMQEGKTFNVQR